MEAFIGEVLIFASTDERGEEYSFDAQFDTTRDSDTGRGDDTDIAHVVWDDIDTASADSILIDDLIIG